MSTIKYYFNKAGGLELVKQYWRGGVLLHAVRQLLLTGTSKTGLELIRLSVNLKLKQKLNRKYDYAIKYFIENDIVDLPQKSNKTIWVLWWQGTEQAPHVVRFCLHSLFKNLSDWKIVILTEQNYKKYVTLPEYIIKKQNKGIIGYAHFADIIRLELLIKYGGLWLDSTVLCTSCEIPNSIIGSDLFVYQSQKPGADGHATLMSNWLIYAKSNQRILRLTLHLIYEYWKSKDYVIDYFFFHKFFAISCDTFSEDAKRIPSFCNSVPHILLLHLFDEYNEQYWNDLKQMTCFHKLSYKLDAEKCENKGTYYETIIKNELL